MGITITYPVDSGSPIVLSIPGASWGEESGYIFADDIVRTLDGTLNSYRAFKKRRKALAWEYLTTAQKTSLETLFAYGGPFIFADAVDVDNQFTALMVEVPAFIQDALGYWSGSVQVEMI
jgi:hypothetical protein